MGENEATCLDLLEGKKWGQRNWHPLKSPVGFRFPLAVKEINKRNEEQLNNFNEMK